MPSRRSGHAVMEFALAFPFFLSFIFLSADILRLAFRQFVLERQAFALARAWALSDRDPQEEYRAWQSHAPAGTVGQVSVRLIGRSAGTGTVKREAHVVQVRLEQTCAALGGTATVRLVAEAREPRFRSREDNHASF